MVRTAVFITSWRHKMNVAAKVAIFAVIGAAISAIVAGLAGIAPAVFGWLTVPFWVLPAIAGLGAHDVDWPWFGLSGIVCYGTAAFIAWTVWQRHRQHKV